MSTIWFKGNPFCEACGELLGTKEVDWGCFACGGEGFDDDGPDDDYDYGPVEPRHSVLSAETKPLPSPPSGGESE
jgi:hypothetical protein